MKKTALRPFILPAHHRQTLANGLTVHVIRRGQLPLAGARLVLRGGDVHDEPGRLGVADFATRLMRRGAAGKSADELSEEIEFLGATLSGFAEEEMTTFSFSAATKHLPHVIDLMAQMVLQPEFPEKEIESSRRRSLAQLVNDFDDPDALADRALARAFWGKHPYGNEMQAGRADLEAISRSDLVKFHTERLGPRIAHLFIVGDADLERMLPMVEKSFGGWSGGPTAPPQSPPFEGLQRAGEVVIVDKPDQSQVQFRIAANGVRRGHPDLYALTVMNSILGGGFTSRLLREIRVKRGLSYGAGSHFDRFSTGGMFSLSSFTKTGSINELIDVALGEVQKLKAKGVTAKEVDTVKRYIIGTFPSKLETNESLSGLLADIEIYGLPADWTEQYRGNIDAVTVKHVNEVAEKYLFGQGQSVMTLVGNAAELEKRVAKYGRVSVLKPKDLE